VTELVTDFAISTRSS